MLTWLLASLVVLVTFILATKRTFLTSLPEMKQDDDNI